LIGTGFNATRWVLTGSASREFVHELLHLSIHGIASANSTRIAWSTTNAATVATVAPVAASLAIGTITSHVTSIATNTTDDVGGEVALLGAVVLAVTNLTTVLASLVLIVTKSTVEGSQLTKLVALEFVLTLRDGCGRLNDVVNKLLGFVHLLLSISHDKAVEIFFLVASVSGIRSALALLDRALATNGNLGSRLGLHLLEGVSTRSYE
jgi:uncharacterized membrane protein